MTQQEIKQLLCNELQGFINNFLMKYTGGNARNIALQRFHEAAWWAEMAVIDPEQKEEKNNGEVNNSAS